MREGSRPAGRESRPYQTDDETQSGAEESVAKKPRRFLIGFVIVALVVIAVIILVRHRAAQAAQAQAAAATKGGHAVPVAVAPVVQRDVPVYLDGLGNANALNTVTVKTRIDGQLLRFDFQEGQMVHAGQELALIDPAPSEAALAQATANRFKDAATLENARRDLARYADLFKSGVVSQQLYDTQRSQVNVSEGAVKADEAQIQQAQLNVSFCHIKAPLNGRIGIRFVDPGNMVHASDPNGLLVITQMQPIAVLFTLPEDNLAPVIQHMRTGQLPVEAWSRDNSTKLATGRMLTIDNQIDPNTGTFRCKAIFDNADSALFPNQFINARLQIDIRRGAMVVPSVAVQHGAPGTYVYVVQPDKTVAMKTVAVAQTEGTTAVLTSGVQPGDLVVTDGADKLQPKGKVEIAGSRAGGGRGAGGAGGKTGGPGGKPGGPGGKPGGGRSGHAAPQGQPAQAKP